MRLFLGVDGGQSGTTALVGDESGRALGAGHGGPCNHAAAAEGRRKLVRAVGDSVAAACAQAGIDARAVRFASACFGMSGGPEDKQAILREILPADVVVVTDDAVIALAGATAGEPGIVTIAGTGSIAFGRNAAGSTARVGGWGYIFGDEGGGFERIEDAIQLRTVGHGPALIARSRRQDSGCGALDWEVGVCAIIGSSSGKAASSSLALRRYCCFT